MLYDSIVSIYTSLFGGIITIFGISIAAIIALTQVLQPVVSHSQTRKLLRSYSVIITGLLMAGSLAMVSVGILGLSYSHDILPNTNAGVNESLSSAWYLVVLLLLVVVTIAMTIKVFYEQTSLLIPTKALKNFEDSVRIEDVRKYFGYKGAVRPFPPMNKYVIKFVDQSGESEESDEDDSDDEFEKLEEKYKKDLAEYEAHKKEGEKAENPLVPIESYLFSNLKKGDLSAFIATLKTFESLIKTTHGDKSAKKYVHEIISYYSKVLERIAEGAVSDGSISFLSEALESSHRVASYLISQDNINPVNKLQEYWKNTAYDSMSTLPIIFKQVMEIFRDTGETILRQKKSKESQESEVVNNIFRSLGWIGEQYLGKHKPERRAMMNSAHQTEFSSLMNTVLAFGWVYQTQNAEKAYPLIYFDCLYVIGKTLIQYYDPQDEEDFYANDISNSLFSLMYEHESFGEAAANAKNAEGAWIAMKGLSDFIRIFKSNKKAKELKKNTLEGVLRLGSAAYVNDLTERSDFGLESVPDYSLKLLRENSSDVDLSHEGMEIFIKAHGNMDKIKEYLRLAQPAAGTDFDLNLSDD